MGSLVANVKVLAPTATVRSGSPGDASTRPLSVSPVRLPPTVNVLTHVTETLATAASVTPPVPLATVQICGGAAGWVLTLTEYEPPLRMPVANANAPFEVTGRSSPALFWRTSPVPSRPLTVPP